MSIKLVAAVMTVTTVIAGNFGCSAAKVTGHRHHQHTAGRIVKVVKKAPKADPVEREYVDCEDVETNGPCVTFDDVPGGWVIIDQYEPTFKEHRIAQCAVEDGGPVLPCVWKNKDKKTNKWIVYSVK